ncbi:MAG: DNA mismatch repair endonuclease MutL [Pyrinomonadaceae bacterium]
MNKIRVLPETLANQIAAGEVVERPASVVKELVENAIDAGATRLQVDVELGGRRLIRVSDDGHGMTRDDAVLAFERHATSKIATLDDLGRIVTLGFRGEALASIASVARVELKTKTEFDEAATSVSIEGGRLVDIRDAARDTGTTVSVRDLFFNTPARRKFMRSEATENFHLANIVTHYALAHPEIAFALTSNGREVIRVSPARDLRERAYQIFGGQVIESLIPVSGGREHVATLTGFVSAPRERRTTRDSQYFFVNRRFVRDKTIAGGLLEGYRSILPHGVYPVALLFVDVPVEEIDVNVHPAKIEIRFRRTDAVRDAIAEAVRGALAGAGIVAEPAPVPTIEAPAAVTSPAPQPPIAAMPAQPRIDLFGPPEASNYSPPPVDAAPDIYEPPAETIAEDSSAFELAASMRAAQAAASHETVVDHAAQTASGETRTAAASGPSVLPPVNSAAGLVREVEPNELSPSGIRPIGQLHESFIIAVDDQGLLLVDQHVAHERILFDRFRHAEGSRPIESQNLLLPETVDLTPAQLLAFDLIENDLADLGFGVMRLSGRTIAIKSIPADLAAGETRTLFAEILNSVERDRRSSARQTIRDDIAASLACKAAVKINMKLTPEKMQWLIDRLLVSSSPTTCPHGRPVILRLTMRDIERGFHRT